MTAAQDPTTPDPTARYPAAPVAAGHRQPAPRRVRGVLAGQVVFDTVDATYEWHWPHYPQYAIPAADVDLRLLEDEGTTRHDHFGPAAVHGLVVGAERRPGAARVRPAEGPAAGTVRFDFAALDAWYEDDERIFVHPRSPYVRVDALRCDLLVRVELDGAVLADAPGCVRVYETGLPPRHYLPPLAVDWSLLEPSPSVTECPYKGTTSAWWSLRGGGADGADLAWRYDFPTRQLLPIAGLVAFYDERVDTSLGGRRLGRPVTHFA